MRIREVLLLDRRIYSGKCEKCLTINMYKFKAKYANKGFYKRKINILCSLQSILLKTIAYTSLYVYITIKTVIAKIIQSGLLGATKPFYSINN